MLIGEEVGRDVLRLTVGVGVGSKNRKIKQNYNQKRRNELT